MKPTTVWLQSHIGAEVETYLPSQQYELTLSLKERTLRAKNKRSGKLYVIPFENVACWEEEPSTDGPRVLPQSA